ncbi:MAG: PAS domain-containing protein [Candidatus Marinimicrobia bacterium]|nr:PAS domain-containing protein [Candidatus Neomarinimicrobiota bacterium]
MAVLCLGILQGQNQFAKFNHLAIEDGLSNSYINCMLQDSKGFMWFGTQDGLNKFDGYNFKVYKHDSFNPNSISDNYIRFIIEARDGFLWIGTESGGINKFDPTTEVFTYYTHDSDNPNSLSHNSVKVIFADLTESSEIIWIGTIGAGVDRFDPVTNTFTHYRHDPNNINSISNDYINSIHVDSHGYVWVGTLNGLNRFDEKNNRWIAFYHDPGDESSISHSEVYSILEANNGTLLFGTLHGMNLLHEGETFVRFDPEANLQLMEIDIQSMIQDQYGSYWIGTFHGLRRFDKKDNDLVLYLHDSGDPNSLSDNNITCVYEDNSGLLWVGTGGGGINKMKPNVEYFLHYSHIPGNPNSLSHPSIRGIYEDKEGILWVGGYGGLNRIDRAAQQYRHYRADASNPDHLNTDAIYSIIGDTQNDNILWIGSEGEGLFRFEKSSGKVNHYLEDDSGIQSLFMDSQGLLWIATSNGLARLNTASDEITTFNYDPNNPQSLSDDKTVAIYQDSQDQLWIGTLTNGLNRFDPKTEQFTRFTHDIDNPNSLSINRIKSIFEDRSGILWIGTNGGGLNQFDRQSETFKTFTVKDGLPNDVIYGILEDNNSNLWLSTNLGLSRFNPNTEDFKNYDVNDGLQSNEFNTSSFYKSISGEMFFGGINGFNAFYPERMHENPFIPPVVFTDFLIFNESVPIGEMGDGRTLIKQSISETSDLLLSYKDAVISFEFTALSYAAPTKNHFAYQLKGFDKDWIKTGAHRRYATYTDLSPGKYIFKVKASNHDDVWNDTGTSINIYISPPAWKTWWAYTLYLLTIILLIVGSFQWRFWQMKRRNQDLEALVKERTAKISNHEQELEQQYTFLNSVIESLSHPFYVIDVANRTTVLANTAASRAVALDPSIYPATLLGPGEAMSRSEYQLMFVGVKQTGLAVMSEQKHLDPSGKEKVYQINSYPIFDEDGQVTKVIKYWLDITERKELEITLKESLQKRNQELTAKAMRMAQDKEILIGIVKDVQEIYKKCQPDEKSSVRTLLGRLNDQISSDNQWDEFELWFQEVHKDFFNKLNERYPDLVPREMKICAFLKLNLTSKEIANLTNLTVKTIEVYRSTLRKKLNIPSGVNLLKFINEI